MWRLLLALLAAAAPAAAGPSARVPVPRLSGTPAAVAAPAALAPALALSAPALAPVPTLAPPAALPAPALAPAPSLSPAPAAPSQAPLASPAAAPSPALAAITAAFAENPAEAGEVDARVRASAFGRLLDGADYKPELAEAFAPFLDLTGAGGSAEGRAAFMRTLAHHTGHRAEEWTYLFRDHPLWKDGLDAFLDARIAERSAAGERRLDLQSVGAAYGSEAYSLAISVDRALRRNGEDPAAWDVRIPAYDVSLLSLLTAGRGLYRRNPRDAGAFERSGAAAYFAPGPSDELLLLKKELASWIKPVWADLNDARLQPLVTATRPDAVFANYLLFHLRLGAAAALGQHWLEGSWATRGFLSMAQVVVAEVGASPLSSARMERPLLAQFDGNVGIAGRMFWGDTWRAPGGLRRVWRDWRRSKSADGKAAAAARRAFVSSLYKDPAARGKLDADGLAFLEELSRRHGVEVRLTNEALSMLYAKDEGVLYVDMGLLLAGRVAALKAWAAQELAGAAERPSAPRVGAVLLEGAPLTLARERGAPVLRWLERPVTVISDAFRSDNANKTPEELKAEREAGGGAGDGQGRLVRGLN